MLRRSLVLLVSSAVLLYAGYSFSSVLILLTHSVTGVKIAALSLSEYAAFRLLTALSFFLCLPCALFIRYWKKSSPLSAALYCAGAAASFAGGTMLRLLFLSAALRGAETVLLPDLGYASWGLGGVLFFTAVCIAFVRPSSRK